MTHCAAATANIGSLCVQRPSSSGFQKPLSGSVWMFPPSLNAIHIVGPGRTPCSSTVVVSLPSFCFFSTLIPSLSPRFETYGLISHAFPAPVKL